MPTITIDSSALPSVLNVGNRPAWNQIAAVMSMPLPLESRVKSHWPAPVMRPAENSSAMWRPGEAALAASVSAEGSPAPQASCWTALRRAVSSAAPMPAARPVRTTANQKRNAPASRSEPGTSDSGSGSIALSATVAALISDDTSRCSVEL